MCCSLFEDYSTFLAAFGIFTSLVFVVKNPSYQELPECEAVIKPGRTSCCFTGSYDGKRALSGKVFRGIACFSAKQTPPVRRRICFAKISLPFSSSASVPIGLSAR